MKHRLQLAFAILAAMVFALPLCAQSRFDKTIVLKNGSQYIGRITEQVPGEYMELEVSSGMLSFTPDDILVKEEKEVDFKDLGISLSRWVLRHGLVQGTPSHRFAMLVDIKTEEKNYTNLCPMTQPNGSTLYGFAGYNTVQINWDDVKEIRCDRPGHDDEDALLEVVTTFADDVYNGTVTRQTTNGEITVEGDDWKVTLQPDEVKTRMKDLGEEEYKNPILKEFTDVITFTDGTTLEGQILGTTVDEEDSWLVVYSEKEDDVLFARIRNIASYRTNYTEENGFTVYRDKVYINYFPIPSARRTILPEVVFYNFKKPYAFPEGIAIKFYRFKEEFSTDWKLIPLEIVQDNRGIEHWGYKKASMENDVIAASRYTGENDDYTAEYDYLARGYYAFISPDGSQHFVFKVTK